MPLPEPRSLARATPERYGHRIADVEVCNGRPHRYSGDRIILRGVLGYSAEAWETLASHLRRHAIENESVATDTNEHGQEYEVRGRLTGPAGRSADVTAVWIVLKGEDFPRFVTAFPAPR